MMGKIVVTLLVILLVSCTKGVDTEQVKKEIIKAEKSFEEMALQKGIAEAFWFFADDNAAIVRGSDSLIYGKEGIKNYYSKQNLNNTTVNWSPDFVEVSASGDLAYTYGKYVWKFKKPDGTVTENKGIFHTVWKRQQDKSWKYVWD